MRIKAFFFLCLWLVQSTFAQIGYVQKGVASYYHPSLKNLRTSSGERYNPNKFTAAHRKLLFNTIVRVTNPLNQKTAIVTINDRGPYHKKRILDLSYAAAKKLGIIKKGFANIRLEVIGEDGKIGHDLGLNILLNKYHVGHYYDQNGEKVKPKGYGVQLAAFAEFQNARIFARVMVKEKMKDVHIKVVRNQGVVLYKIIVGEYKEKASVQKFFRKLKKNDFSGYIVHY